MRSRPFSTTILALGAVLLSAFGCRSSAVSSASGSGTPPTAAAPAHQLPHGPPDAPRTERRGLGAADGVVHGDVTVFATVPAVAKLDPGLRSALRRAAEAAAHDGVHFYVDSGWRSPAYQEELFRQAISTYGSRAKAARWVATADTSAHVSGDAVDLGHTSARKWLAKHGATYGLCRTYRNEPWHFELRPSAVEHGCPRMYADPTHDPRMQQ